MKRNNYCDVVDELGVDSIDDEVFVEASNGPDVDEPSLTAEQYDAHFDSDYLPYTDVARIFVAFPNYCLRWKNLKENVKEEIISQIETGTLSGFVGDGNNTLHWIWNDPVNVNGKWNKPNRRKYRVEDLPVDIRVRLARSLKDSDGDYSVKISAAAYEFLED